MPGADINRVPGRQSPDKYSPPPRVGGQQWGFPVDDRWSPRTTGLTGGARLLRNFQAFQHLHEAILIGSDCRLRAIKLTKVEGLAQLFCFNDGPQHSIAFP